MRIKWYGIKLRILKTVTLDSHVSIYPIFLRNKNVYDTILWIHCSKPMLDYKRNFNIIKEPQDKSNGC